MAKEGAKASVAVQQQKAKDRARQLAIVIAELRREGCTSILQIAAGLNERRIPAPRGGVWRVVQVARLMRRMEGF